MPLSVYCLTSKRGRRVSIAQALALKPGEKRSLICVECKGRVIPHGEAHSRTQGAHFEHHRHNPKCSLCDKAHY